MNNPLDELFNVRTPKEVDTTRLLKYFKDLERAVSSAVRDIKHSEDPDAIDAINTISNELSWFEDDFHKLLATHEDAEYTLSVYRDVAEERLTYDEKYELNAIRVKHKLMELNK